MFTKIFGVATLLVAGVELIGIVTVGNVVLGLLVLAWAISWLANA